MNLQDRIDRRIQRNEFKNFIPSNEEEAKYYEAAKRVKKIKSFYTHASVYVIINILIVIVNIQNLHAGESYFKPENFFTAFFWGIGLFGHALGVFLPDMIMGANWEERKIREFMESEKAIQNKWK